MDKQIGLEIVDEEIAKSLVEALKEFYAYMKIMQQESESIEIEDIAMLRLSAYNVEKSCQDVVDYYTKVKKEMEAE